MGNDPDDGAVVDERGRVFGIGQLYVADASIMPTIPSANTNLPTIMVAERISSWLREAKRRDRGGGHRHRTPGDASGQRPPLFPCQRRIEERTSCHFHAITPRK
jgi:choline dehydrogenase-like flavoprotein